MALAAFVAEISKDRAVVSVEQVSVSEVLDRWLQTRKKRLSPATVDRYRVAMTHVDDNLGGLPVARLRPHHIEDLYNGLVDDGLSGSSIRKLHWAMRQSLAWAHRRGYVSSIATDGVELPPLGAKELVPPSSTDVRKVLDLLMAENPDWGTLVSVMAWTGCRRGEVVGLQWGDVDLSKGSVVFRRSVAAVPGGIQVKGTKTGDVRRLALGPQTVALLKDHRKRCDTRARSCGTRISGTAYVFSPDPASERPYNPYTVTRTFQNACSSAGVARMRLHDLRHHSATTLLKNGTSVGEVMDRHGWRTVEMVNRYRHLLDAGDVAAATTLEEALS